MALLNMSIKIFYQVLYNTILLTKKYCLFYNNNGYILTNTNSYINFQIISKLLF